MQAISRHLCIRITIGILAVFTLLAMLAGLAQPAWAELPDRPEDMLTPTPEPVGAGAGIELSVTGATAPYHAVVQWQDGLGNWHDVEGWRGEVEENRVLWYVAPEYLGAGPFRWVVYRADDTLGTSENFNLPAGNGVLIRVSVAASE